MRIFIFGPKQRTTVFICAALLLAGFACHLSAPSAERAVFEHMTGDIYYPAAEPVEQTSVFIPPGSGYAIWVDLDSRTAAVYKDGALHITYPVSGGAAGTPSPLGTFQIIAKASWGEGFGGSWLALNVPWGKYGFHGTLEPWSVGVRNGSKGCIRMKNSDAAHLKKYIPIGTSVTITQNDPPFRALKNGKAGSDVLKIQKSLRLLKFYSGPCDGRFGNQTELAVRQFQKAYGLKADGVVGRGTHSRLFGEK